MTKQNLLDILAVKFYRIETPVAKAIYNDLKYYLVKVYDLVGDALRDGNIAFYVEDEGGAAEAAYWSPSEPKPSDTGSFQRELRDYISSKIADGTIEAAYSEVIDSLNENAVFKIIMPDLSEKRIFVDRDINGDLQRRALV